MATLISVLGCFGWSQSSPPFDCIHLQI